MDELLKKVINIFKDEHQDWVTHIKEAEEQKTGIDLNLSGGFATRISLIIDAFQEAAKRKGKKKGGWP